MELHFKANIVFKAIEIPAADALVMIQTLM